VSDKLTTLPGATAIILWMFAADGCAPAPAAHTPPAASVASSDADCRKAPSEPSRSRQAATPPPQPPAEKQAPQFVQTPTLHVQIGEHWLDVLESGVAGDVALDGKVILHRDLKGDAPPWADLVRYFGPIPPFEGVVLLSWRAPGNACNGWGFTFLSVRGDGTWQPADVPYCGGPAPVITWAPTSVTMRFPPHPPNRGGGTVPEEVWVYKDGVVRKVSDATQRRPPN
jgi:hypothetical protein